MSQSFALLNDHQEEKEVDKFFSEKQNNPTSEIFSMTPIDKPEALNDKGEKIVSDFGFILN